MEIACRFSAQAVRRFVGIPRWADKAPQEDGRACWLRSPNLTQEGNIVLVYWQTPEPRCLDEGSAASPCVSAYQDRKLIGARTADVICMYRCQACASRRVINQTTVEDVGIERK